MTLKEQAIKAIENKVIITIQPIHDGKDIVIHVQDTNIPYTKIGKIITKELLYNVLPAACEAAMEELIRIAITELNRKNGTTKVHRPDNLDKEG